MSKMKRRTFNETLGVLGPALFAGCSGEEASPAAELSDEGPPVATAVPSGQTAGVTEPAAVVPQAEAQPPAAPQATVTPAASSPEPPTPTSPAAAQPTPSGPVAGPVPLGSTGLMTPRLAMGTGTAGWEGTSDQVRLGSDAFVRLMRHGIDRGASFLDTADLYGSHAFTRLVLQEVPRDRVTVATKIWWREDGGITPATSALPEVERFLQELGTDYLDIVLIHSLLNDAWQTELAPIRDDLSELKQRGVVRAVGCSCHSYAALRQAAEDPWVDVIFARVNPAGIRMDTDGQIEDVTAALQLARSNGKGVVGMKIYGDGGYANDDQRIESLRFVFENELVDAVTIGHLSEAQFDDTVTNLEAVFA